MGVSFRVLDTIGVLCQVPVFLPIADDADSKLAGLPDDKVH
jgi:hypothetical protein